MTGKFDGVVELVTAIVVVDSAVLEDVGVTCVVVTAEFDLGMVDFDFWEIELLTLELLVLEDLLLGVFTDLIVLVLLLVLAAVLV